MAEPTGATGAGNSLIARFRALLSVGESLRSRAIQGGAAVVLGDLYSNGVRLGGNLVMTRILFPEAFGLMLVVNLLFFALVTALVPIFVVWKLRGWPGSLVA